MSIDEPGGVLLTSVVWPLKATRVGSKMEAWSVIGTSEEGYVETSWAMRSPAAICDRINYLHTFQ